MALSGYRYFGRFSRINLTQTQKRAFSYLSLIVFAVTVFGILAIKPSIVSSAKLLRKLDSARELNEKLQQKILTLEKAQQLYIDSKENIKLVESALPEKENLHDFIKSLVTSAEESNIHILGVQPRARSEKPNELSSSSITVSIRGTYSDIYNYVGKLETLNRVTTIRSVNIEPEDSGVSIEDRFVVGDIVVNLYWSD